LRIEQIEQTVRAVVPARDRYSVMSNEANPQREPGEPLVYQVRVRGHLRREWTDWFGGLTVTPEDDGNTLLTGAVIDQAALHGLLKKVRDLGMTLVSVNSVGSGRAEGADTDEINSHRSRWEEE
jgi:hypothetical protein